MGRRARKDVTQWIFVEPGWRPRFSAPSNMYLRSLTKCQRHWAQRLACWDRHRKPTFQFPRIYVPVRPSSLGQYTTTHDRVDAGGFWLSPQMPPLWGLSQASPSTTQPAGLPPAAGIWLLRRLRSPFGQNLLWSCWHPLIHTNTSGHSAITSPQRRRDGNPFCTLYNECLTEVVGGKSSEYLWRLLIDSYIYSQVTIPAMHKTAR